MDMFDRTFLPAATGAGLSMPTISRHISIFRRRLGAGEPVLMLTRCLRPDRPRSGEYLLALSRQRLVITHESRLAHRIRLHLDAPIHELSYVDWIPDPRLSSMEFAATAIDGIRERFWIRAEHPKAMSVLDATFGYVFQTGSRSLIPAA
jgi:hypothetical protein